MTSSTLQIKILLRVSLKTSRDSVFAEAFRVILRVILMIHLFNNKIQSALPLKSVKPNPTCGTHGCDIGS
jgi:hypothetical protein